MNSANISFPQPATPEPAEPHPLTPENLLRSEHAHTWLRMDPSLTQAVLAKTEEELLAGLAALMRNKVEAEKAARRLTQILIDTEQAQKELERVRQQVRQAEDELAFRLDEQQRLKDQAADAPLFPAQKISEPASAVLTALPSERAEPRSQAESEMAAPGLWLEAAKRSVLETDHASAQPNAEPAEGAAYQEKASMIAEVEGMQRSLLELREERRQVTEQDLHGQGQQGGDPLLNEITVLESYTAQLRDAQAVALKAEEKNIGLPLWLGEPLPPVAEGYDPYRLESEFFTDERLDAHKVADLVADLPGLDGCLLVKNRGAVLASRLADHYFEQLRVPERDYEALFGRLPGRRDDLRMPEGRVATYQLENGFLTVTQADHIFMITTSGQPRLKPGMPRKLATIAREVAKMYPQKG